MAADVLAHAAGDPDRIALRIVSPSGAERWSFGALDRAARGIGAGLLARGLRPGDRLMLRLGNTVDFPLCYLGAIAAGIVPVPTASGLTVPEVTELARGLDPAAVVAGPGIALPEGGWPVITADEIRAMHALPPCDWDMGDPDRLAYIVFTSGTSGRSRAVMHAHRAFRARRMMWTDWYGLTASDRLMHAGAFNWTYTLGTGLMDPWAAGACALIPAEGVTPAQVPLLLKRYDVTIFAAAPGVYRQMLRQDAPLSLPALRHGLSAGEHLADSLRAAWIAATGRPVCAALGMSECSTFVSENPDRAAPPGASGWPQRGRRVAVLGPDGVPVPRGEPGVLAVHRSDPGLFLGYLGADAETAARFSGDWFLTGDSVRMDDGGAIHYLGRDDDMMNAGGFRVSPLEVEAAMTACLGVTDCAAAEVRLSAETSVIACFYTSADPLPEATLAAHATALLARYKQPRLWVHVAALPRGANNKMNRRKLREEWEANHGHA